MSYKVDTLIAMMDEVLMRLDRIERQRRKRSRF